MTLFVEAVVIGLGSQTLELQSCFILLLFLAQRGRREGWDNHISDGDWLSKVE